MRREELIDRLHDARSRVLTEGSYTAGKELREAISAALNEIDTFGALVRISNEVITHLKQGD